MVTLIEGAGDLALLMALLVALAFTILVEYTFTLMANVLDVSILGHRPFHGVANKIRNVIIGGLNEAIRAMSHVATRLFNGLVDSLATLLGALIALALALPLVLGYLLKTAMHEVGKFYSAPIAKELAAEKAARQDLARKLAKDIAADQAKIGTLHKNLTKAIAALRTSIYLDDVQGLRREVHALEAVVATLPTTLPFIPPQTIPFVPPVPPATTDEAPTDTSGTVVAGLAALGATVATIAAESGLDNAFCRSKVKEICTTNPQDWSGLIAGLLVLESGFSLRDLATETAGFLRGFTDDIKELVSL